MKVITHMNLEEIKDQFECGTDETKDAITEQLLSFLIKLGEDELKQEKWVVSNSKGIREMTDRIQVLAALSFIPDSIAKIERKSSDDAEFYKTKYKHVERKEVMKFISGFNDKSSEDEILTSLIQLRDYIHENGPKHGGYVVNDKEEYASSITTRSAFEAIWGWISK